MSKDDTNYILPYKTNKEVVTKAKMCLNCSVYAAIRLKTKFDENICNFLSVGRPKCPGFT